jgi:hypothetical protein
MTIRISLFSLVLGSSIIGGAHSAYADVQYEPPYQHYKGATGNIILTGVEAKELFEFLPSHGKLYNNFESPYIFDVQARACLEYGQVGDAHGGQRLDCILYSETEFTSVERTLYIQRGETESPSSESQYLGCTQDLTKQNYICQMVVAPFVQGSNKTAFANAYSDFNNYLGRSLKGKKFESSNGKVGLYCNELVEDRYYDCFVEIGQ